MHGRRFGTMRVKNGCNDINDRLPTPSVRANDSSQKFVVDLCCSGQQQRTTHSTNRYTTVNSDAQPDSTTRDNNADYGREDELSEMMLKCEREDKVRLARRNFSPKSRVFRRFVTGKQGILGQQDQL